MSDKPRFSVVIPLYNKEDYIKNTLKSVLNQTFKAFEIIIVNDGSNDNSLDIVKTFSDSRITVINQKNKGLSGARNSGINKSNFDYIAFLDADDLWCEDYLETIYKMINGNTSGHIFTTASVISQPKNKPNLSKTTFSKRNIEHISNYFTLKKNLFSNSSIVINKSVFDNIGIYNEDINYGEEEDFFIRCFSSYKLTHYKNPKVFYLKGIANQLTSPHLNIKRIIPHYEKYLNNKNKDYLKPYIDFIYFKLVVLYKMQGNHTLVRFYKEKIDVSNLSLTRKIKFYLPTSLFYAIKTCYLKLSNN